MDEGALRRLLSSFSEGELTADELVAELRTLPFADLGFATVDHHRHVRQGMAEAVYGPGKTPDQAARIVAELLAFDRKRSGLAMRQVRPVGRTLDQPT